MMRRISVIFGTRPEAIKLCPVILAMREDPGLEPHVCVTGQHRQMLDQVLDVFGIVPDVDLNLMRPNQTLAGLTCRILEGVDAYLKEHKPYMVLVQGDTTTVVASSLAAFYNHIPIGHVEAGLRTWNLQSPWPEEANRVIASRLATLHFAPTEWARQNLLKEGVTDERIIVTGNTVTDALLFALDKAKRDRPRINDLPDALQPGTELAGPRMVLITGHRRESFGQGFENICLAIAESARRFPDVHFVYPVHLNPNVRDAVNRLLGGGQFPNVHLIEPVEYLGFVALMHRATLILSDSGGIQEEAPSLGKPVLVMRDCTERPEAVAAGVAKLVGTDIDMIVGSVTELLDDATAHARMSGIPNPFGDGHVSSRILAEIQSFFAHGRKRDSVG